MSRHISQEAYRYAWGETPSRLRHLYEQRGTMTIHEDDGTTSHRTLMRALCRHASGWGWCDDHTLRAAYPPVEDPASGVWCPDCRHSLPADADATGTGNLLDLLKEAA